LKVIRTDTDRPATDDFLAVNYGHLNAVTCLVPRTRTCLGDRAFGVAGPRLWNSLPISLRQPHLSLGQFRRAPKTHLFDCDCRA